MRKACVLPRGRAFPKGQAPGTVQGKDGEHLDRALH